MEDLHMYKTEITLHDTTYLRLSVVVEVCQLEGRALDVTEVEIRIVVHDNVVRGRVDGSLPHGLRHQEEVISLWEGNNVIDHGSTWRIAGVTVHLEEPGVDPLADDDVSELQLVLSCIDYGPTWKVVTDYQQREPQRTRKKEDEKILKKRIRTKEVNPRDLHGSKNEGITESDIVLRYRYLSIGEKNPGDRRLDTQEKTRGNTRKGKECKNDRKQKDEKSLKNSHDKRAEKAIGIDSQHPKDKRTSPKYRNKINKQGKRGDTQGFIPTQLRPKNNLQARMKEKDTRIGKLSIPANQDLDIHVMFGYMVYTRETGKYQIVVYDIKRKNTTILVCKMYIFMYIFSKYCHKSTRGTHEENQDNVITELAKGEKIQRGIVSLKQNLAIDAIGQFHVCQLVFAYNLLAALLGSRGAGSTGAERRLTHRLKIYKNQKLNKKQLIRRCLTELKDVRGVMARSKDVSILETAITITRIGRTGEIRDSRHGGELRRCQGQRGQIIRNRAELFQRLAPKTEHPRLEQENQFRYSRDRSGSQRERNTTWNQILLIQPDCFFGYRGTTGIHTEGVSLLPDHQHTTRILSWLLEDIGPPMLHNLTVITNKRRMNLLHVKDHKLILTKRNPESRTKDCQWDPDRFQTEEPLTIVETWYKQEHGGKNREPHRTTGEDRLVANTHISKSESLQNNPRIPRPASNITRTQRGSTEKPARLGGQTPTPTVQPTPPPKLTHDITTRFEDCTGITYKHGKEGQERNIQSDTENIDLKADKPQFHDRRSKLTSWSRCEEELRGEGQEEHRWTKDQNRMKHERFHPPICKIVIYDLICI